MLRQEDEEFEASLGYIVSIRPARATQQDLVSKQKQKQIQKQKTQGLGI
jgi:hypothetical protein